MTDPHRTEEIRGYLRGGMVGCGSLLLLVLVMATVIVSLVSRHPDRFRSVLATVFDTVEDELVQGFGPDVSPADRAAFAVARQRFRSAWMGGRLPASAADRVRRRLISDSRKGRLGAAEVRSLTRFLNDVATPADRAA